MGELKDIQNPIVLQERVLDLEVRQRVVIKYTKKEEEKQHSKGPDYEKYLSRLKKHEEAHEKRQKLRKKGKDLSDFTTKAGQLKIELQKLEDEKEMISIMQRERMEAISENISKLTDELMQMSEIVIKVKNIVDQERNNYQKLVIKQVAIDRLQDQVNEQRRLKELEQQKQALKFQSNIKQKAKNILYEQQQKMSVQNVVGATILLQKIYRGWKTRTLAKKRKEQMFRAVKFVQAFYKMYCKKKKNREFAKRLLNIVRRNQIFIIKMLQVNKLHSENRLAPKAALIALRGLVSSEQFAKLNQRQVQIQQFLNKNQKGNVEDLEDFYGQEENDKGANSSSMEQHLRPNYENKTKKAQQDVPDNFRSQELPAVITLQRGFRKLKKNVDLIGSEVKFTMGGISSICRICNIAQVEILCRSCEQCIFCKNCYDKFHKSYHRRNHRFYELKSNSNNSYDVVSNATEYKEEIFKHLKGHLDDLKNMFQMDQNTGLYPLDEVYSFFENKVVGFRNSKNLLQNAKAYLERYIEKKEDALALFKLQNIEQKYNPEKQYISHGKFLRSFQQYIKEK